jgi:hypothetical protein
MSCPSPPGDGGVAVVKLSHVATFAITAVALATYGCNARSIIAPPEGGVEPEFSATPGRHLGFDSYAYPGDRTMRAWRAGSPYEWVGYYLPAPCHRGTSWSGKRETLAEMGWGTAVIYVGQQWWPKLPTDPAARTAIRNGTAKCANFRLHGAQGRLEADDAIARTLGEGFAAGTVIFLDIEYMDRVPQGMRDYYRAWVTRVLEDGRYRPGVYVHTRNASLVHADVRAVFETAGVREEPQFWVAGGRTPFSTDRYPHEGGHAFASVWQGILDTRESWSGTSLMIDVNVASLPSPSTSMGTVLAAGD